MSSSLDVRPDRDIPACPQDEWIRELTAYQDEFDRRLSAGGLHFEGKPYPVSLRPLEIPAAEAAQVRSVAEAFHGVLEHAADLYREIPEIRAMFPEYRMAEAVIAARPGFAPTVQVCRIDGIVDRAGDYQILETGTACPGGVIQNGVAGRMWLSMAREHHSGRFPAVVPQALVDEPDLFIKQLLSAHRSQFDCGPAGAAVVNLNGRFTNEVDLIADGLRSLGVETEIVDACGLTIGDRCLRTESGLSVTLIYNKLDQLELINSVGARGYLQAAADNMFTFVNPLICQTILEDKAILAVLSGPRFAEEFTAGQRSLVARHVPWTRVLRPGRTTDPDGAVVDLPDFVLRHRDQLVLKPRNLTRGEGVHIGPRTAPETWTTEVGHALASGSHVVQRYVTLPSIAVPYRDAGWVRMLHGLDVYLFAGRGVGFQCRASLDPVINIGKRGTLLPVVVISEPLPGGTGH